MAEVVAGATDAAATTNIGTRNLITPVHNVKGYGATGDGVTDDAAAIRAAVDALGGAGGVVFFPPGTYLVKSGFTLQTGQCVWGAGADIATVKVGTAGIKVFQPANGSSDVGIYDLGVYGSGHLTTIEHGFYALNVTRPTVRGCRFENINVGVQFSSGINGRVESSTFLNIVGNTGSSLGYGVLCDQGRGHQVVTNRFSNIKRHAIYMSAGCSRFLVANNWIETCYNVAIQVFNYSNQSIIKDGLVMGNFIRDVQNPSGQTLQAQGIYVGVYVENVQVVGNVMDDVVDYGIKVEGDVNGDVFGSRVSLQGNLIKVITGGADRGIYILNYSDVIIRGNTVGTSGSASPISAAIHLTTSGTLAGSWTRRCQVVDNYVYTSAYGVYLDNIRCEDNVVFGNTATGIVTGNLRDDAAGTVRTAF